MSQEGNPSNFNGLILEIRGKALIQNLYLDQVNQHQIEIGLPQLDTADRQIMLSHNGNASNSIDLSKYSSINIVEISQQPTAARQREDINLEPALARNQERLSGFYQSYKNEDSSIDWSKVATKITLSNTSGTFYDHEDPYTTGLKIEFSTQGVESIEFRDGTTGETIATLSASQLPATMVIGNLCQIDSIVRSSSQGTFCSPTTRQTINALQYSSVVGGLLQSPTSIAIDTMDTFYVCNQCSLLYSPNYPNQTCFGSGTGHSPVISQNTTLPYKFILPYDTIPVSQWSSNPSSGINNSGCAEICGLCGMVVPSATTSYTCPVTPPPPSPTTPHNISPLENVVYAYWIETRALAKNASSPTYSIPGLQITWYACSTCGGLYYRSGLPGVPPTNACYNDKKHDPILTLKQPFQPIKFTLLVCNNISISIILLDSIFYLTNIPVPSQNSAFIQVVVVPASSQDTYWELRQPDNTSGDYVLKSVSGNIYLGYGYEPNGVVVPAIGASPQIWQIQSSAGGSGYIIQISISNEIYYLTVPDPGVPNAPTYLSTNDDNGLWNISVL